MCCTKRNREMKLSQPPEVRLTNLSARIYNPDTKKKIWLVCLVVCLFCFPLKVMLWFTTRRLFVYSLQQEV